MDTICDRQTARQTTWAKTICLPTLKGGDIIRLLWDSYQKYYLTLYGWWSIFCMPLSGYLVFTPAVSDPERPELLDLSQANKLMFFMKMSPNDVFMGIKLWFLILYSYSMDMQLNSTEVFLLQLIRIIHWLYWFKYKQEKLEHEKSCSNGVSSNHLTEHKTQKILLLFLSLSLSLSPNK